MYVYPVLIIVQNIVQNIVHSCSPCFEVAISLLIVDSVAITVAESLDISEVDP